MNTRFASTLLATLVAVSLRGDASAETYHVVDIGTLEGFTDSVANGINADGLVVGMLLASASVTRAFQYDPDDGVVVPLEPLLGGTKSEARAVNDAGTIVGSSNVIFGSTNAVRWSGPGMPVGLGSAAGPSSAKVATAINASGEMAGTRSGISFPPSSSALVWSSAGTETDFGGAIEGSSGAAGINDAGQVVGTFSESLLTSGAFIWTEAAGADELLDLPDATVTRANGINAAGVAVGTSGTSSSSTLATRWPSPSQPLSLGVLSGGTRSVANAINALGIIVGFSDTESGQHAMIWTAADGMRDLDALSDAAEIGMTLQEAKAINTSGQIVGYGDVAGHLHAFLATPVPEAAAAWPAFLALLWLRRRRA